METPHFSVERMSYQSRFNGWSGPGKYNCHDLVFNILTLSGGYNVGLSNIGLDYDFRVERDTKKFGGMNLTGLNEMVEHSKKILGEGHFEYFSELGKQLKPK